ncbi:hypothetical protein SALBM135S_03638 [Streptomyces alboniger]
MKLWTGDTTNPTETFSVSPWKDTTRVVPFGDFDGDRCNDLIVRTPEGEARLYTPVCGGGLPAPDSAYKRLATDWSKYDTLLASGDQTGDGRPDLLARDKATGDLYRYTHDGSGGFEARVKIRSAWTGYQRVIGAGDLNGDGLGDVLALDTSGVLWRYDGLSTGKLKDRVRVFSDWGASYKDVIGAGDVNGDGKQDLVSRDTSNRLWLNAGDGTAPCRTGSPSVTRPTGSSGRPSAEPSPPAATERVRGHRLMGGGPGHMCVGAQRPTGPGVSWSRTGRWPGSGARRR